jgi:hypothetical protein
VRIEGYQSITLTSIPEPKDTDAMGMQSEESDVELVLSSNVVGDVVKELVSGSSREIAIENHNGVVFESWSLRP